MKVLQQLMGNAVVELFLKCVGLELHVQSLSNFDSLV